MTDLKPVSAIRRINDQGDLYHGLILWCLGCEYTTGDRKAGGAHMLPVSGDKQKRATWDWNGDLIQVTLNPSILTRFNRWEKEFVCHSFLRDGFWQFLGDCTHQLKNQTVPMLELPDWLLPNEN